MLENPEPEIIEEINEHEANENSKTGAVFMEQSTYDENGFDDDGTSATTTANETENENNEI
jgi:hypothetical protein